VIPEAVLKAIAQVFDPRFLRVLLMGLSITIALLVAAYVAVFFLVGWLVPDQITLPLIGSFAWADQVLSWASVALMMILSIFLMVPVASAVTGFFLDDVAQAVEDRHYSHLGRAHEPSFGEVLRDSLRFLTLLILANIVALILYVIFLPFAPLIFWALNGFLLGREYFHLVAARRVGVFQARQLRAKHFVSIWAAGTLMAVPLSVPLLNLLIPILGVATFTHIFHRLIGTATTAAPSG